MLEIGPNLKDVIENITICIFLAIGFYFIYRRW